jgi:hypothetical protein
MPHYLNLFIYHSLHKVKISCAVPTSLLGMRSLAFYMVSHMMSVRFRLPTSMLSTFNV